MPRPLITSPLAPPSRHEYHATTAESLSWAADNNLAPEHAQTHSLFSTVKSYLRASTDEASGSRASCSPFVIRCGPSDSQLINFDTDDLEVAVASDYLDAGEGSTNPNKGWRMQPVGGARRGSSFQGSRLSFEDVANAKGTVIFNSAGAHISSTLSASSLAALDGLDGAVSGVCLNMYVTRGDAKVSAPPHTDKQDVMITQTQGRKHWRVFSPPDNTCNSGVDAFARGKGTDDLPLEMLESSGSKLLLEVTLNPGDLLFVPARFPHTTDTLSCYSDEPNKVFGPQDWSIHLTVGLDSHVWSMNYLSMRALGLRRFGIRDVLLDKEQNYDHRDDNDQYVGEVNDLSKELREILFSSVDGGIFSVNDDHINVVPLGLGEASAAAAAAAAAVDKIAMHLFLLNGRVNAEFIGNNEGGRCTSNHDNKNKNKITTDITSDTATTLSLAQCVVVVTQFRDIGQNILNTHRDLYVAAAAEEDTREREVGGWTVREEGMSKEQVDRLSIFRVPMFFEELDMFRDDLRTWADDYGDEGGAGLGKWAASQCILNGDQIEADLSRDGMSWSPAKVVDARDDGLFDLQLFDGSVEKGVKRDQIKGPHGIGVFI